MSTRKVTNSIFVLCLFGIFVSNALSASPETMLIGKWKGKEGKKIEFVKDGILIIENQGARYRIIDKERIEFDLGMLALFSKWGGPRPIFKFTVSDDELLLISLDKPNETEKYRRVKVDTSGNDASTYLSRGNKNLPNYQEAIKNYDKAIELDPKFESAYYMRGVAYCGLHNYREAIKHYNKAIELDPENPLYYSVRAWAYGHVGNYEEAMKDCNKAIELDPKSPILTFVYSSRGYIYSRLGNYEQGIKDVERSIALGNPNDPWPYYIMACIFSIQNNADLACQWLKKAIDKGYKDWEHLKSDKDFDNIRNTPCFQEIIKSH